MYRKKKYRKRRNNYYINESNIMNSINTIENQKYRNRINNISNESTIDSPKKRLIDNIDN